jgi:hypothetical protein
VLDPFAGSGTTLVQSLESGHDAAGIDVAAFNCLLTRVKTTHYNEFVLETEVRDALVCPGRVGGQSPDNDYIGRWFAPQAAAELLAFARVRTRGHEARILHGDAREARARRPV